MLLSPEDEAMVTSLEARARGIRLEASHLEQAARTWRINGGATPFQVTIIRRRLGNVRSYLDQLFEVFGRPDR